MHGEKKEGYIPIKEREREGRKEKRKKNIGMYATLHFAFFASKSKSCYCCVLKCIDISIIDAVIAVYVNGSRS